MRASLAIDKFDLVAARRSLEQARRFNERWPEIALVEADIAFAELQPKLGRQIIDRAKERLDALHEFQGRQLAADEAMRHKQAAATPLEPWPGP